MWCEVRIVLCIRLCILRVLEQWQESEGADGETSSTYSVETSRGGNGAVEVRRSAATKAMWSVMR
jgi:hypothetical protein